MQSNQEFRQVKLSFKNSHFPKDSTNIPEGLTSMKQTLKNHGFGNSFINREISKIHLTVFTVDFFMEAFSNS